MRQSERSLLLRQSQLLQRSAGLRDRWARDAQAFAPALGAADWVVDGWRWLRAHPEWPAGAIVVSLLWRPARLWRWSLRAWGAWRLWRRVRPVVRPFLRGLQRKGLRPGG